MRSRKKTIIMAVSMFVCVLLGALVYCGTRYWADQPLPDNRVIQWQKDENAMFGTDENPFLVLEIVPDLIESQFGYFIPGCEPIDMEKAKFIPGVKYKLPSTLGSAYDIVDNQTACAFYDQLPESMPVYVEDLNEEEKNIFKKREDLNYVSAKPVGSYSYGGWRKQDQSGYSQKGDWIEKTGGGFTKNDEDAGYTYVGAGQGEYVWVPSETGASVREPNGDLFEYVYIEYKHKDTFIQTVFKEEIEELREFLGISDDEDCQFKSQVITLTPKDFQTNTGYLDLIDKADLITIHAGSGENKDLPKFYNALHANPVQDPMDVPDPESVPTFWDDGNDLTYDTVMRIVERMGTDNPAALFLDITSMFGSSKEEKEFNIHKLLYMTLTYKTDFFWDTYGKKDENGNYKFLEKYTDTNGKTTVKYTGKLLGTENEDARIYWGESYAANWNWSCNLEGDSHKYHTSNPGDVVNPFLVDPETGEYIGDNLRYYNINSGSYNIFDKIFTYHGDTTGVQSLLTGGNMTPTGMKGKDLNCYLFSTTSTIDAFTGEYEDRDKLKNIEAMRFILKRPVAAQPKLRILEIQPCDEFIYGSDGWKEYYQALFPWYKPRTSESNWLDDKSLITVTTMPTWEFIGSTGRYDYDARDRDGNVEVLTTESSDDLIAKYDLIIIGSNQDASNVGLAYTAIGGAFSDGTRHSGNDITLKKLLELQDFLRAGKPIVADDGLYKANKVDVDTAKVDQSSKVYDLLTWKETGSENIFIHDSIDGNKMKTLISKGICRLEFFENGYPDMYNYEVSGGAKGLIDPNQVTYNKNGSELRFNFFIRGVSDDTYSVALNLDLNGDGVYSGSLKECSEVKNMNVATGKSNSTTGELETNVDGDDIYYGMHSPDEDSKTEQGTDIPRLLVYDSNNKEVEIQAADKNASNGPYYYKLKANTAYTASYTLPEDVQGMIPWKFEVQSNTNAARRSSAIGYTLIKGKKVPIRVLQMNLQLDMSKNSSVSSSSYGQDHNFTAYTKKSIVVKSGETYELFDSRNPDGDPETTSTRLYQDMSSEQKQTVEKFEKYIAPVEEFSVDIQYLYNEDWYQLFGKETDSKKALDNWNDFLADYDMLVFGFVDGCCFTNNEVFVDGVKDFVAQGKGMILSHDIVGNPNPNPATGEKLKAEIESWLREESGQYRMYYNKNGSSYVESYEKVLANGAEIKILDDLDNENYLAVTLSDKTERVAKDGKINDLVWAHPFSRQTTFVKLTNNGQITTYPYKLGNVLEVLSSHTQYYQLDLEHQQSGDVNVWFNLSDMHDSDVKKFCQDMNITGTDEQKQINLYSAKDQDCRNSFYIYNKGNITYTGSGHGEGFFGQKNGLMTDDEVMLFVNTMVAAYRQPDPRPYSVIDNADVTAASGTKVFYLNYDGSETATSKGMDSRIKEISIGGVNCECVGIKFSIHDIAGAKSADKKYYIRLSHGGNLMADGSEVIVKELDNAGKEKDDPLKRQDSTSPYYQVELGKSYIMYVPYADVANDGGVAKYTISTHATYLKGGRLATTPPTEENAQVMLMPLFELN